MKAHPFATFAAFLSLPATLYVLGTVVEDAWCRLRVWSDAKVVETLRSTHPSSSPFNAPGASSMRHKEEA
ncbi:MAG: hypothetical protein ACYCV4_02455 [Dermatophilaceae bacterium]